MEGEMHAKHFLGALVVSSLAATGTDSGPRRARLQASSPASPATRVDSPSRSPSPADPGNSTDWVGIYLAGQVPGHVKRAPARPSLRRTRSTSARRTERHFEIRRQRTL